MRLPHLIVPSPPQQTQSHRCRQRARCCPRSGTVTPDGAVLLACGIYIAVLILACALADPLLRAAIAAASIVTLAYTPLLKRATAVKNLAVAFVIAASPFCGAIATGLVRALAHNATPAPLGSMRCTRLNARVQQDAGWLRRHRQRSTLR
jgi:UbiA prenyltransferase family